MIKKLLLLFFLTTFAAAEFKLGMPKYPVSKTFDKLTEALGKSGVLDKNNIKIVKIDMGQKDLKKLKKEIESLDLFFITGSYFKLYFNIVKPDVKTVVIGTKKVTKVPKSYDDKLVGIYRASDMENLVDISKGKAIGLLSKKGSSFNMYRAKDIVKSAQNSNIKMIHLSYGNKEDLERIFRENKEKLAYMQMWPASVGKELLPFVIKLQFKYDLPLLAQRMSQVEKGAALGYVLDYDTVIPETVNYIDKIASGVNMTDLKSQDLKRIYVINMRTITKMNLKLDKSLLRHSKIVGFKTQKSVDLDKVELQKGNYTIAMPNGYHLAYRKTIEKLAQKGYIEGRNLKIIRYDINDKNYKLPKGVDMIFSVANVIDETLRVRNNEPMVLMTIASNAKARELVKYSENVISMVLPDNDLLKYIKDIFPNVKRVKLIGNKRSNLPYIKKGFFSFLKSEGLTITSYLFDGSSDLETELSKLDNKEEVVLLMPPSLKPGDLEILAGLQNKYKLIVVSQLTSEVKGGLALSISADIDKVVKNIAEVSHQILQGVSPSECKVAKINLEFFINLKAIKSIGVELPENILRKARVIIK